MATKKKMQNHTKRSLRIFRCPCWRSPGGGDSPNGPGLLLGSCGLMVGVSNLFVAQGWTSEDKTKLLTVDCSVFLDGHGSGVKRKTQVGRPFNPFHDGVWTRTSRPEQIVADQLPSMPPGTQIQRDPFSHLLISQPAGVVPASLCSSGSPTLRGGSKQGTNAPSASST